MDRDNMNDRASAALGPQTRELTEAELDAVSGSVSGYSFGVENPTTVGSVPGGAGAGNAIIAILIG